MDDSRDGSYALVALARIPHLHEVGTRGERQARVFTEAYVVDVVGVVTERQHLLAARQVPDFSGLVCIKRQHHGNFNIIISPKLFTDINIRGFLDHDRFAQIFFFVSSSLLLPLSSSFS